MLKLLSPASHPSERTCQSRCPSVLLRRFAAKDAICCSPGSAGRRPSPPLPCKHRPRLALPPFIKSDKVTSPGQCQFKASVLKCSPGVKAVGGTLLLTPPKATSHHE